MAQQQGNWLVHYQGNQVVHIDGNSLVHNGGNSTLCRQMGVRSLAVFGSVARNEFIDGQSDIDFLVEFETITADRFFGFLEGLKKLFRYENIDLVTLASLKNKFIRDEILKSQEYLYAA